MPKAFCETVGQRRQKEPPSQGQLGGFFTGDMVSLMLSASLVLILTKVDGRSEGVSWAQQSKPPSNRFRCLTCRPSTGFG